VACGSCRALHHQECWTYNGGRCAIYGCPRSERDPLPSLRALPAEASILRRDLTAAEWILVAAASAFAAITQLL